MTTKEFLRQGMHDKRMIANITDEIRALESAIESVKAIRYDKINVQTSASNQLEENIIRLEELREKWVQMRTNYNRHYSQIVSVINQLDNTTEQAVITSWYLSGLNVDMIAQQCNCSPKYVYNVHSAAIKKISKILQKNREM